VDGFGFWPLLGDAEQTGLTAAARSRVFAPGAVLCVEGEPTTHVFIVLSGWVKIITVTREGREMLEALRGAGDVIGDIAGTITGYRTATIQAIDTVRTLILGAAQFVEFLDGHPNAAQAHRQAMAGRQQAAFALQRSQVLFSGAQRLAGLLLDLDERVAESRHGMTTASLPLSQEELASLIGASRSTVTRALHDWRSRRIIRTDQRHITILDRPRLLRLAGRPPRDALPQPARRLRTAAPRF
jgi:CRP/FNR family transcriptional regulator, cyclic AMP receptor protein